MKRILGLIKNITSTSNSSNELMVGEKTLAQKVLEEMRVMPRFEEFDSQVLVRDYDNSIGLYQPSKLLIGYHRRILNESKAVFDNLQKVIDIIEAAYHEFIETDSPKRPNPRQAA